MRTLMGTFVYNASTAFSQLEPRPHAVLGWGWGVLCLAPVRVACSCPALHLITLQRATFTDTLPSSSLAADVPVGTGLTLVGFGRLNSGGEAILPERLQIVSAPLVACYETLQQQPPRNNGCMHGASEPYGASEPAIGCSRLGVGCLR